MSSDIVLNINGLYQSFGDHNVLHNINLDIVRGQFVALVGESGCGKSTLLKAILGTLPPKKGTIKIDGDLVIGPNRNTGIVYQNYALYDWLTSDENVAFGLKLNESSPISRFFCFRDWAKLREKHLKESREILDKLRLHESHDKYPSELSGGMKQRVAIAQALIMKPKVLLLDEPFGALDESTREDLQNLLLNLYAENLSAIDNGELAPWTVVIITHELNEAFLVSDRVVALSRNWKKEDEEGSILGATKVWDKSCPVFHPGISRDYAIFHELKEHLKSDVLDAKNPIDPDVNVSFWKDLENGVGTGVAITGKK